MTTTTTSRKELTQKMNSLKAEGFEHVASILDTDGTGGIFFVNYATNVEAIIRGGQIIRQPYAPPTYCDTCARYTEGCVCAKEVR